MTKTLTEQWREGKLPRGHYYCKLYYNDFEPRIQECVKSRYDSKSCIPMSCGCEGEEVLAPVPNYDEHNEFVQKIHILNEQNTKQYNELCEEIKKNNILKKKLELATKALQYYADGTLGSSVARQALKEMEGVR